MRYIKVWFSCPVNGETAGLVFTEKKYRKLTITSLSSCFPMSEAPKMKTVHTSKFFHSWVEAFESPKTDMCHLAV